VEDLDGLGARGADEIALLGGRRRMLLDGGEVRIADDGVLVMIPGARTIRVGNQSRTSDGKAGWLTEMPTPIRKLAANRTGVESAPRNALKTAMKPRPATSAHLTPSLAISSEPGTDARASSRTGSANRAPTAFSSRWRSRWISGINGGIASMVRRRQIPPSHRRRRWTKSFRVSFTAAS